MESSNRTCPVCGKEAHVFTLNGERTDSLAKNLLADYALHQEAEMVGFWCLGCLVPYLVVFPDDIPVEQALRMAGFPPKGGVL